MDGDALPEPTDNYERAALAILQVCRLRSRWCLITIHQMHIAILVAIFIAIRLLEYPPEPTLGSKPQAPHIHGLIDRMERACFLAG